MTLNPRLVNGQFMMTTENRKVIYESPDGGKTIYTRLAGTTERILHSDQYSHDIWGRINRFAKWKDIVIEAENNQPLLDLLEQAEAFYELTRNRE